MRVFVSTLLGLAAVLLAWHASTPPRQARGDPAISSLAPTAASAPQVQPVGAALGEILRSDSVTSAFTPIEPARPAVARSGNRGVAGIADAAKRNAGGPVAKVRELTPGSKEHSEAIAEHKRLLMRIWLWHRHIWLGTDPLDLDSADGVEGR